MNIKRYMDFLIETRQALERAGSMIEAVGLSDGGDLQLGVIEKSDAMQLHSTIVSVIAEFKEREEWYRAKKTKNIWARSPEG